jgi:hypothetical protein
MILLFYVIPTLMMLVPLLLKAAVGTFLTHKTVCFIIMAAVSFLEDETTPSGIKQSGVVAMA